MGAIAAATVPAAASAAPSALLRLERETGGRLGVMALDTASGATISYRAGERFPMCSTFKFLAVAAVLAQVDRGQQQLGRHVIFTKADLLEYAPVTRAHVGQGYMTVEGLCEAAIEYSDNTAANLLLGTLGAPAGVTRYARSLGDRMTRLDREEPALNSALPGDVRDTTTPAAMVSDMRRILLGSALTHASKERLINWLVRCRTGSTCLRAGLPASWRIGDKTGSGGPVNAAGDSSTRNDIAIAWPPNRAPWLIAAYLTGSKLAAEKRDAVLASVGRMVA